MSQEILVRDGYDQVFVALDHALAGQAGVQARIDGAVDEVFFFFGDLGQVVHAGFHVNVAGAAAANAATVVLQFYIVIESHIQHRFALHTGKRLVGFAVGKFKGYIN